MNIQDLAVNIIIIGMLLFTFQKVIEERMTKRIEGLKAQLEAEKFKNETRLARLYARQAEVISELNRMVIQVQTHLSALAQCPENDPISPERMKEIASVKITVQAFWIYFSENRIHLPKHLERDIQSFYDVSIQVFEEFLTADISKTLLSGAPAIAPVNLNKQFVDLTNRITPLREAIEDEFRVILGG